MRGPFSLYGIEKPVRLAFLLLVSFPLFFHERMRDIWVTPCTRCAGQQGGEQLIDNQEIRVLLWTTGASGGWSGGIVGVAKKRLCGSCYQV